MQDDNHPAASTAQDIKAAARDMLRMGSRWAHSALDWIDDRRHEMNHRNRDDRDFGSERERGQSTYSASGQDRQERERYAQSGRYQGGRHEQLQGRSDRDIQGDYSGGGYDQVGARDWNRDRESERQGWSRQAQSRPRSPDNESLRGDYGSDTGFGGGAGYGATGGYSGAGYGYGASGPGGVGYGAPGYGAGAGYGESRYHGDFQSRGLEEEGYGSTGREFGGSHGQESDYGRGYGSQGAYSREQQGYGQSWRSERSHGSTAGRYARGDERSRDERGLSGYGGYGERGGLGGQRDERLPGYGSQRTQPGSQAGQFGRSYRGVGPRNYTRSDERIREDLNERLTDAHDIDASQVTVEVNNGIATLTGTVGERWMKHRAEDIADGCSGVRDVRNNLQVASRSGEAGRGQDTYGAASAQYGGSSPQGASSQYGSSSQQSSQYGTSAQASSQYGGSSQQGMSGQKGHHAPGTQGSGGSSQARGVGTTGASSGSGTGRESNASSSGSSTQGGTSGGSTGPNV